MQKLLILIIIIILFINIKLLFDIYNTDKNAREYFTEDVNGEDEDADGEDDDSEGEYSDINHASKYYYNGLLNVDKLNANKVISNNVYLTGNNKLGDLSMNGAMINNNKHTGIMLNQYGARFLSSPTDTSGSAEVHIGNAIINTANIPNNILMSNNRLRHTPYYETKGNIIGYPLRNSNNFNQSLDGNYDASMIGWHGLSKEQCTSACKSNPMCYGLVYKGTDCWLKSKGFSTVNTDERYSSKITTSPSFSKKYEYI
jgi:hypothetical protein